MASLRQLTYLVNVADLGHFGKAAEKLHVTQPTLSMQLAKLEQELGSKLLQRLGGKALPTPIGRSVLQHARTVLKEVRKIEDLTRGGGLIGSGVFHLGVSPTLGPYMLPSLIARLHQQCPELKLSVREHPPAQLETKLSQGDLDLIISPLPISGHELQTIRLFEEPLLLAVSPDHPLAQQPQLQKRMLKGQRILALESGFHLREQVAALCNEYQAELLRDFEGTSLDTLRHMAGMGLGMAFLPALYVHSEIAGRNDVTILRLASQQPYREIGLAYRKSGQHPDATASRGQDQSGNQYPYPLHTQIADLVSEFIDQYPDLRRLHNTNRTIGEPLNHPEQRSLQPEKP